MAGIDLTTAQEHLQIWLDAEKAVALGQAFTHEGRSLTRANLGEIRRQVEYWERKVGVLSQGPGAGSGIRVQRSLIYG